jgi:hypothetical protein
MDDLDFEGLSKKRLYYQNIRTCLGYSDLEEVMKDATILQTNSLKNSMSTDLDTLH